MTRQSGSSSPTTAVGDSEGGRGSEDGLRKGETQPKRRICGLPSVCFWVLLVVILLIIVGGAIGGGVGGAMAVQNKHNQQAAAASAASAAIASQSSAEAAS
jgi:hypothetical protein